MNWNQKYGPFDTKTWVGLIVGLLAVVVILVLFVVSGLAFVPGPWG
jgi:hypothetical protein